MLALKNSSVTKYTITLLVFIPLQSIMIKGYE